MIAALTTWADVALCVGICAFFWTMPFVTCWMLCREADRDAAASARKNWPPPPK